MIRGRESDMRHNDCSYRIKFPNHFTDLLCVEKRRLPTEFIDPFTSGSDNVSALLHVQFEIQPTLHTWKHRGSLG